MYDDNWTMNCEHNPAAINIGLFDPRPAIVISGLKYQLIINDVSNDEAQNEPVLARNVKHLTLVGTLCFFLNILMYQGVGNKMVKGKTQNLQTFELTNLMLNFAKS